MSLIEKLFSEKSSGERYDSLGSILTAPYAQALIEASGIQAEENAIQVLDIGTGTAILPLQLCQKKTNVKVVATDFSPVMVNFAKEKVEKHQLGNQIETKTMDAMNLTEVADSSVDYVFGNFVYMLIPDPNKGFQEMYRVLKQGGKGAFSVWTRQDYYRHFEAVYKKYATMEFTTNLGLRLADGEALKKSLQAIGFKHVQVVKKQIQWIETPEVSADLLLHLQRGIFATEENFQAAKKMLTELIAEEFKHTEDKKAHFIAEANVVVAEK